MKILFFSDGHIGEYTEGNVDPATGYNTRLLDTLHVWDWALRLATEREVDQVVFGGDRFRSNRPPAWMRDLADAKLAAFGREGIPIACLLGNHDLYDRVGRFNSWDGAKVWNSDPSLNIFDQPAALHGGGVTFHFLPYGFYKVPHKVNPLDCNILVFHDNVIGMSSYGGKQIAQDGIQPEEIDRPEFFMALGGHVHLRQELPFRNTIGVHIGSPLERFEDGDQGPKGALLVDTARGPEIEFIRSPLPGITRTTAGWDEDVKVIADGIPGVDGSVVHVAVSHEGQATPRWRRKLETELRARGATSAHVKLELQSTQDKPSAIIEEGVVCTTAPLSEQLMDYSRAVHGEDLLPMLREIVERTC